MGLGRNMQEIPLATLERLMAYSWPGNIRELENVIERCFDSSPGSTLMVESNLGTSTPPDATNEDREHRGLRADHILRILEECQWQIKGAGKAADRLGLNPSTLHCA